MAIVWTLKVSDFIARVLQKCSVIASGETASSADFDLARDVIDGSLKSMHANGLMWWAVSTEQLTFSGDSLARPDDCVECLLAYWVGAGKVRVVERTEYEAAIAKVETGTPELLFDDNGTLRLWPAPTSGDLRLTYQREIMDSDIGAPLDIPKKIILPLIDLMAYELVPYFGVSGELAARIERDAGRASASIMKLNRQSAEPGVVEATYY
jgi:hypothetical protein